MKNKTPQLQLIDCQLIIIHEMWFIYILQAKVCNKRYSAKMAFGDKQVTSLALPFFKPISCFCGSLQEIQPYS